MITDYLNYSNNKSNFNDVYTHLYNCNDIFNPPLNSYVDLGNYSQKIVKSADRFECWSDKTLVGLIAAYLNDFNSRKAFITNVSVLKQYQGLGISKKLLENVISKSKNKKFLSLELEVYSTNNKAISLYEKYGFRSIYSNNSIKMHLIFNE